MLEEERRRTWDPFQRNVDCQALMGGTLTVAVQRSGCSLTADMSWQND